MCLATPAKIETLVGEKASVSLAGATAEVMTTLTPEVKVGDWVLVHAGYAIAVIEEEEALKTYALLKEIEGMGQP